MADSVVLQAILAEGQFDPEKLKAALGKFLPFLRLVSKLTPNPYDDLVVAILDAWVNNPALAKAAADAAVS